MLNNNPLNLFPTTQTPQSIHLKLQKLLYSTFNRSPTAIQTTLASSLFNDTSEYMSTLDMNRAASFTFGYQNNIDTTTGCNSGESVANEIWKLVLDAILARPSEHSVLSLTKTISLIEHVLIHGAERVCCDGELLYRIEMVVGPLRELNTALVEQKLIEHILNTNSDDSNPSGRGNEMDVVLTPHGIGEQLNNFSTRAAATMIKLRGGSIDKGYPVRMAAGKLYTLVSNPNKIQQVRNEKAASGSLVPIGSANKAGFITDEGRYRLLQQKMAQDEKKQRDAQRKEELKLKQTRSNLIGPASKDGFGSGYISGGSNGANGGVVGAAHSLEDMIKSAKFELEQHKSKRAEKIASLKKGYSDNPMEVARRLQELERNDVTKDPKFLEKERGLKEALEYLEELQREQREKEVDDGNVGDLLGGGGDFFGGSTNVNGATMNHIQAFGGDSEDLLGFQNNAAPVPVSSKTDVFGASSSGGTADLLGFGAFAGPSQQPQQTQQQHHQYSQSQPNQNNNVNTNNASSMMGNGSSFLPSPKKLEMRPSLVTGIRVPPPTDEHSNTAGDDLWKGWHATSSTNEYGVPAAASATYTDEISSFDAMGGIPGSSIQQSEEDEDAKLEKERKMNMAAGLFAGVFADNTSSNNAGSGAVMNSISSATATSDPFESMLPTPPMDAPPPPPIEAPPPLPPNAPPPPPPNDPPPPPPPNNNGDASVEQMQEIIRQQQQQMNQMMQMMQQMGMQGGAANENNGGWSSS